MLNDGMKHSYEGLPAPTTALVRPCPSPSPALSPREPFFYTVASHLQRVFHLSREQHLDIWKRVLDLYAQAGKRIPESLKDLCQEAFIETLMENEIFWSTVGPSISRQYYARATDYLPAVYAMAALVAAWKDDLPLTCEDQLLLADSA